MIRPPTGRIFGTLNIAISFPAAGMNGPARERGERSVKTAGKRQLLAVKS
jgi:hypothetical protein